MLAGLSVCKGVPLGSCLSEHGGPNGPARVRRRTQGCWEYNTTGSGRGSGSGRGRAHAAYILSRALRDQQHRPDCRAPRNRIHSHGAGGVRVAIPFQDVLALFGGNAGPPLQGTTQTCAMLKHLVLPGVLRPSHGHSRTLVILRMGVRDPCGTWWWRRWVCCGGLVSPCWRRAAPPPLPLLAARTVRAGVGVAAGAAGRVATASLPLPPALAFLRHQLGHQRTLRAGWRRGASQDQG
eukprot:gene22427-biopygen2732